MYFIGRALSMDAVPQEDEISDIRWVEIGSAASKLTYDNDRLIVNKARAYLALSKI